MTRGRTPTLRALWSLVRHHLTAAAELGGEILQLGQAVPHRQDGLGIVDMDSRRESQRGNGRRKNVHETQWRMFGHQMTSAFQAIFALAGARLREGRDMFLTGGNSYRLRLPQAECVHGTARPRPARTAVTIGHGFRHAADLDLHRVSETDPAIVP